MNFAITSPHRSTPCGAMSRHTSGSASAFMTKQVMIHPDYRSWQPSGNTM